MGGKGNASPPAGAWSKRCLNYISHSALEARGCLCLDTFEKLKFKEWVGGYLTEGWEVIRKWSKDCGAGRQLWLGLEPLAYFFPAPTSSKV